MKTAPILSLTVAAALVAGLAGSALRATPTESPDSLEALGEALFFDTILSANRTQSCATCHDPAYAFADPRGAASPGDDGSSLGKHVGIGNDNQLPRPARSGPSSGSWSTFWSSWG